MKSIIKKIIIFILRLEAKLVLKKYKPKIVAVTGTVGKTSAKEAIASVLSREFYLRKSEKSYNSEFGVPLTILGTKSGWNSSLRWFLILFKGLRLLIVKHDYPELLVLEMGVDRPGDMDKLTDLVKPDIAVITALGKVPVHVEYFKKPDQLAKEKIKLAKAVSEDGYVLLNGDDEFLLEAKDKIKANYFAYGFSEDNDLVASNYHITEKKEGERNVPDGLTFKVDYKGSIVPIRIHGVFGRQAVYAVLAAIATGRALGLNLVETAEAVSRYKTPAGRLKLLKGIKNSFILDDTYNSSPIAVKAGLEVLGDIPAKRRIAVLGDMLELGEYTIDEHKKIGRRVQAVADVLFAVGPRSKFIAGEAEAVGFNPKNIFEFSNSEEAKKAVQEEIEEGGLIFVKGSQSMRMEKIVEEIMAHPDQKNQLLVRQEEEWK